MHSALFLIELELKNTYIYIYIFDIIDFYPSISDELLNKSIEWARKHTSIDDQEYETLMHSRRTLLHDNKGNMWNKKEIKKQFDVSMGAFDGADVCEVLRCVGRSNFDKGRHNLTTLIQKSTYINASCYIV